MKNRFIVGCGALICTFLWGSPEPARAQITVTQNREYIAVEGSETDCRLNARLDDFLEATELFSGMMTKLQERFKGTAWEDLSNGQETEIRETIRLGISKFYEDQITANETPEPVYIDPGLPEPIHISGEGKRSIVSMLLPSAIFATVSMRLLGKDGMSADDVKNAVAHLESNQTARALVNIADPKLTSSIQVGFVAVPRCHWEMPKNPERLAPLKENNSEVLEGDADQKKLAASIPGKFHRGWRSVLHWDVKPFAILYVTGSAGIEYSGSGNKRLWEILRPTFGIIRGDINYATDVNGNFFSFAYNFGGKVNIAGREINLGSHNKIGCINSSEVPGTMPIPFCHNFLFTAYRYEPREANYASALKLANLNVKLEGGYMFSGGAGVRTIARILQRSPEEQDEWVNAVSFIFGKDRKALAIKPKP